MSKNNLSVQKGASLSQDPVAAAKELYEAIYQPNISFALFYCSPEYDLEALGNELHKYFRDINLIGCTTAGEITPRGYLTGTLTGVSIASPNFSAKTSRIDALETFEMKDGQVLAEKLLDQFTNDNKHITGENTFGFLLIDGLSCKEEAVVSSIYHALNNISLFGGSAGDGTNFNSTRLYHDGVFRTDCAVFTLINTSNEFEVFKTQHFVSSDDKMVVTEANPERRIVTEINGEPAGLEYAKAVGLEVDKLTPLIFATYPVVVKLGGKYYVRSIQKVNEDGSLTFFCAIDEGIVLTVAKGVDMITNIKEEFSRISNKIGKPELILGCDCILRHLELDQKNLKEEMSEILKNNNVIGFSTYGEQYNAMHVNQTFTGVAIGSNNRC